VNGHGVDDFVIGAKSADPCGVYAAGESYLVFGRAFGFPALFELSRLRAAQGGDGSEGVIFAGTYESDRSGVSVSGAGDVCPAAASMIC
jgi:hypothetical protein